jgi:hypothetical protein
MKSVAKKYFETRAEAMRCKPRSDRKKVLTERLKKLLVQQIRREVRDEKRGLAS